MESILLVIHLIVAVGIIAVVLVQPPEAGDFMSGGGSNMAAPRRTADALTRVTGGLAACFFVTSLLLAIIAGHRAPAKSIIDAMPAAEQPAAKAETPKKPEAPISK
jgi:preprotein translocase subunit SecG